MAATDSAASVEELESANHSLPPERYALMLRQVTRLFLNDVKSLDERQVALFDDVFLRLIERADPGTLAQLSNDLSGASITPSSTLRRLAFHEDVSVAGPVLSHSRTVTNEDLIEIASHRDNSFLLAISSRQTIEVSLSDKLVERGDLSVLGGLIQNLGAKFSEAGYGVLAARVMQDDKLAEQLARRSDVPRELRPALTARVRDIRMRRLQAVPPALQGKIRAAVAMPTDAPSSDPPTPMDYSAAMARMVELSRKGALNDRSVNRFAVEHEYVSVVAALAFLSESSTDVIASVMKAPELDGLMVACKAARLNWTTTKMIVHHRPGYSPAGDKELERAKAAFDALPLSVAQRTIRLW